MSLEPSKMRRYLLSESLRSSSKPLRTEMSLKTPIRPVTFPRPSLSIDALQIIGTVLPSLRVITNSRFSVFLSVWVTSVRGQSVLHVGLLKTSLQCIPIASEAESPVIFSAAALKYSILPDSSVTKRPSGRLSRICRTLFSCLDIRVRLSFVKDAG